MKLSICTAQVAASRQYMIPSFFLSVWVATVSRKPHAWPLSGPTSGWKTIAEWSPATSPPMVPTTGICFSSRYLVTAASVNE